MAVTNVLSAQVVVVGGGPAGLAAAIAAAERNAHVLLIDENMRLGGQIYRQIPSEFSDAPGSPIDFHDPRGDNLIDRVQSLSSQIEVWGNARVWGIFDNNRLELDVDGESVAVHPDALVLATGAPERPVPFPGWTLPGVITAGAAQVLMKQYAVLPGRKVLLTGTGPLQQVVAEQLAQAGAEEVTAVDPVRSFAVLPHAMALLNEPSLILKGIGMRLNLRRHGVRMLWSHIVTEVTGDGRAEEATVAQVDQDWRPIDGTERTLAVDTVCIGFGQVPDISLTSVAGCEHRFNSLTETWIPIRDERMATTVQGVFSAGDGAGVAGAIVAEVEGEIAGVAAAVFVGAIGSEDASASLAAATSRLNRLKRFRSAIDKVSRLRPGLVELADDETIICRCEEVTKASILESVDAGARNTNEIKRRTRAGMGLCQGRMCESSISMLISRLTGWSATEIGVQTARPPIGPVSFGMLASRTAPRKE